MAAQRRGSVKVFVQPSNDSFEAMATLFFSSRSVRTWNSSSAPCRSSSMYPSAFLLRSTRKRCPTTRHALPDGSYLTFICSQHYRAGRGYGRRLEVRIIEAWITVRLEDGTQRTELWRLITSLLDADRYPALELIEIYHRRWEAETCYFSLKSTILDGRILRSRTVPGIEQELYARLTVYQALIRTADDLVFACPALPAHRISFTVLLRAAADTIVTGELPPITAPAMLVGSIGRAALADLHPPRPPPPTQGADA